MLITFQTTERLYAEQMRQCGIRPRLDDI